MYQIERNPQNFMKAHEPQRSLDYQDDRNNLQQPSATQEQIKAQNQALPKDEGEIAIIEKFEVQSPEETKKIKDENHNFTEKVEVESLVQNEQKIIKDQNWDQLEERKDESKEEVDNIEANPRQQQEEVSGMEVDDIPIPSKACTFEELLAKNLQNEEEIFNKNPIDAKPKGRVNRDDSVKTQKRSEATQHSPPPKIKEEKEEFINKIKISK